MLQAACIQKFRDKNNQIYGYRIQDSTGATRDVKPEALKNAIKNKQIYITNLTLTSDNRLVDANIGKQRVQPKPAIMSLEEIKNNLRFELREIENKYLSKYPKVVTDAVWHAVGPDFSVYITDKDSFLDGIYDCWGELEKLNLSDKDVDTMYKCYLDLWECLSKYHHIFLKRVTDRYKHKYSDGILYTVRCKAIMYSYSTNDDLYWEEDISAEAEKELEQLKQEMIDLLQKANLW